MSDPTPFDDPAGAPPAPADPRVARRLLVFLRPYKGRVAISLGLLVATAAIEAAQPWLVKIAIDRHVATGDLTGLAGLAAAYLGLLVLEFGVSGAQTWLTSWVGQRAMHDLRQRLFEKLQRVPVSFLDRTPLGRLVTRVTSDVETLNELFSSGVVSILGDSLLLATIAITMLVLDWRLALVAFAVVPLVVLVSMTFRVRMRESFREIRRRVAEMNGWLQERVTGLAVVQLFRREDASAAEYGAINRAHRAAQVRSIHDYALFYPLVEVLGAISLALVIWYGGGRILAGGLSFGALVAFLQYAQKFFRPIRDLAEKNNLLQSAIASGERLVALLDEPIPGTGLLAAEALPPPRGEVVFEDVWFRYADDGPWILSGVSFRIPAGTRLALVGATGAGKTTCASLLVRFHAPTRGRILLDGVDLRAYPEAELRARVGLVLQDGFLFSGSIADNVRLRSPAIDDARVDAALAAVGAGRLLALLPDGAATRVGERGRTLSSGQRQLVALARALAHDPPVLVLDEATSSVDSETEAAIETATLRLLAGRTSLVIAHRLATVRRVDRIVVLHHGAVREEGTHDELVAAGGIYARLVELQYVVGATPDVPGAEPLEPAAAGAAP